MNARPSGAGLAAMLALAASVGDREDREKGQIIPAPPAFMWCFDRGLEMLGLLDAVAKTAKIWTRPVWEGLGFTLDGMRGLPAMPREIHEQLVRAVR